MRGDEQVGAVPQGMIGGQRLGIGDVQAGGGDVAGAQALHQRVGVEYGAAADVDDHHAVLHKLHAAGAQQVPGIGRAGQADKHDVGGGQQRVQAVVAGVDGLVGVKGCAGMQLVAQHMRAHRLADARGVVADVARAQDGNGLAVDVAQHGEGAPLLLLHVVHGGADAMQHSHQQRDDVLAHGVGIHARAVGDGKGAAVAAVHLVDVAVDACGDGVDVLYVFCLGNLRLVAVVHQHFGLFHDFGGHLFAAGVGMDGQLGELLPQVSHGAGAEVATHHTDSFAHGSVLPFFIFI